MSARWKSVQLKEICELDKAKHDGEPRPYVGLEHIESATGRFVGDTKPVSVKSATFKFGPKQILYGRLRPYLNKAMLPDFKGHCSTEIFPISPRNGVDRRWLFYWLTSQRTVDAINATCTGARMPRANLKAVLEFGLHLPELVEQKRIVAILDEAFAGIETAIVNTEKNLANARELFESYLDSVFADRGSGWTERMIGDNTLLSIIDGDRGKNYPTKADFIDDGFCLFMNTKNVRPNGFKFDELMFITRQKDEALGKGKLRRRDVVLTTRGTIGNVGIYDETVSFDNIRINSGMLILRPNEDVILSEFLFELIRSSVIRKQIKMKVSGAAQPQLPIKTLVNFTLPVPDEIQDQSRLVEDLRSLEYEIDRLKAIGQQKIVALSELKQSLLQKAFSGELTADRAEREVESTTG